MKTRNINRKSKFKLKTLLPLWAVAILLLASACVTQKKYDAALSEITRLQVDSTFQEYEVTDVAYEKDGVIYKQNKELIKKNYKLDSLKQILRSQSKELGRIQSVLVKLEDKWPVNEVGGKLFIDLDDEIFFKTGSNVITPKGKQMLKELSNSIENMKYPMNVWVIGHTDEQPFAGETRDNWDLSSERSLAVVREMIVNGVSPSSILAGARSKYDPKFPNRKSEMRAKNRRTEVILVPQDSMNALLSDLVKGS